MGEFALIDLFNISIVKGHFCIYYIWLNVRLLLLVIGCCWVDIFNASVFCDLVFERMLNVVGCGADFDIVRIGV